MMRQYELVERVQKYKPDVNEALLNKAYVYAMQKHVEIDEPEPDPSSLIANDAAAVFAEQSGDDDQPEVVTFDRMSEEELLAGIEGLVPPEKSDDY